MRTTPRPASPSSCGADIVLPVERAGTSRRSFLKLAGFGIAGATLASCGRAPVRLVVPRLDESAGPLPGRTYLVATTCDGCAARCGVLARCRDGRPVKLEGNPEHARSRGGLCSVGQASLISLYDGQRTDGPHARGRRVGWKDLDSEVAAALKKHGAGVRLISSTVTSPSTRAWIERLTRETGGRHVEWDGGPGSAWLTAHEAAFGERIAPNVRLARARRIVAFGADFLGTWGDPVGQARDWRTGRDPEADPPRMSRHVQFESRLSLTGTKADERHAIAPWELRGILTKLCDELAKRAGASVSLPDAPAPGRLTTRLESLAGDLWEHRGDAVLLCDSDDAGAQALVILANQLLENYGRTLDLARPALTRRGSDRALVELIDDLRAGRVGVLILHDTNPVYDLPSSLGFADALAGVELIVSTAAAPDETSALAHLTAPTPHALEAWDDAEAVDGELSLSQPTIPPLRAARSLRGSLAAWLGERTDEQTLLRAHWQSALFPRAETEAPFAPWFETVLHDGFVRLPAAARSPAKPRVDALVALVRATPGATAPASGQLALELHANVGVPDGRHAHNPWLQELPDPLTKLTWDNVATLAPATAARLGLVNGDVVAIRPANGPDEIRIPVWTQPGQHPDVVAVALGYGRAGTDRFARIGPRWLEERLTVRPGETVGTRACDLVAVADDATPRVLVHAGVAVKMQATGGRVDLACTQDHHRLEVPRHLAPPRGEVRDAARTITFAEWTHDPAHALHEHDLPSKGLWPDDHASGSTRWGLTIDLSACIGCSGCAVACQAENNVPVVGKDEVRRHREMTWLRVDRYFTGGEADHADEADEHAAHGAPAELRVVHQPMMCQHCANAPCETVCPVLATVHSEDGLNQQVYNRCVGTRYCANNCPYKTRRFNWFDYPRNQELRNLALNPDVTVRTRGVMEKCSMCVQRIQEGRAEAARTGRPLRDGDVQTACQQSCPTRAIVFGDLGDAGSEVSRTAESHRSYTVLGELGVQPGVHYLADIKNVAQEPRHE